jgi:3-hydroxyacyl-CoA dehydrogenase
MAARVKKAAVLGAGVMGSGIAAHLANAGVPTLLLDIVPKLSEDDQKKGLSLSSPEVRNRFARTGLEKALAAKPAAFFSKANADLITIGNFDDDLAKIADCDFVVEAVVENLDVKRNLFQRVAAVRKGDTIIASNTSGLSLAAMAQGLPAEFRKHFVVTHFFNPPRYMRLLEVVGLPDTDKAVLERAVAIGEELLGKGVVFAKDTPNFIANRIGVFAMMNTIHLMLEEGLSIEEVDAIVGTPLGRPKSAAFRTADVVGLDTFVHVAKNCYATLAEDEKRATFQIPPFIEAMVGRGLLGDKSGKGFYMKQKGEGGEPKILAIDPKTLEYRDQQKVRYDSLGQARNIEDIAERIRTVAFASDRAGQFAWKTLSETLIYAANRIPEIADDITEVDKAMKWGFNWDLGPFECWDALGVERTVARLREEGRAVPKLAADLLAAGEKSFYKEEGTRPQVFDPATKRTKALAMPAHEIPFHKCAAGKKTLVHENSGATLYDLHDGVLALEFHTKMNAIDNDIIEMLERALDETESKYEGLVIANDGQNFSAGANLMLILMGSRQGEWKMIEEISKRFQDANLRMRYLTRPVVAAPFGLALGGGAEVTFGSARVCAHAETYMGLVEVGAGLIPAAGGCRELTCRALDSIPPGVEVDPLPFLRKAFETVAMAKVATSAQEAQEMLYLRPTDRIVLSRDRLTYEAKQTVLHLAAEGYRPPRRRKLRLPGESGFATARSMLYNLRAANQITDHDVTVGTKLAWVMMGGKTSPAVPVTEEYLHDLEREAFLSLCGEAKTQDRMQALLMTGKPLRN